jgi:hypothetical protein
MLELQGVGWLMRKTITMSTITLHIKHYKEDGRERIDIDQYLGGIVGSTENRFLDWSPRNREDRIFGHVIAKSRRAKVDEIEEPSLGKNWLPDTIEHGVIEAYAESDTAQTNMTWNVSQVRK